jgi:hypothetical protein
MASSLRWRCSSSNRAISVVFLMCLRGIGSVGGVNRRDDSFGTLKVGSQAGVFGSLPAAEARDERLVVAGRFGPHRPVAGMVSAPGGCTGGPVLRAPAGTFG